MLSLAVNQQKHIKYSQRTAGIHLHQPLSPVTAANQQQKVSAIRWAEEAMVLMGLHQGEATHLMTVDKMGISSG